MWVPFSLVCLTFNTKFISGNRKLTSFIIRQCLLDAYSMTDCPNCASSLITSTPSGEEQLLCNLKNEGGFQEGLDILPILTEESYLQAYPEERKCRAFLEFCGKGDVEAILEVLDENADDEEDGDSDQKMDVLRYQDQIGSMGTGLHLAIRNERMEVIWLLLFLASSIDIRQFPPEVLQAVQNSGLHREEQGGKLDIRSLKDGQGKTPEQTAAEVGGQLIDLVQTGRLKPPEN